jgi:hypothetical protein
MDELDEKLREQLDGYNEPPTPPRELMWARIQAKRAASPRPEAVVVPFRPRPAAPARREAAWATGIAAVLALGFALGRGTRVVPSSPELAVDEPRAAAGPDAASPRHDALTVAAQAHLRQAETYLTLFRASVRAGETDELAVPAARELLATNRFLVNAPGTDPRLRALLLDLELVLVEIAQLQATGRAEDVRLITDGLDQAGMLTRLRTAAPRDARPLPIGVL